MHFFVYIFFIERKYAMSEKIDIRGVKFDNVTLDEAVTTLISNIENNIQTAVFTPNPEIVQKCIEDPEFNKVIAGGDLILPDGIGVIKASKILKTPLKERVPGYETGEKIISNSAEKKYTIYLMGGKPGIAEKAAEVMSEKYPGTMFVGTHDGYFKKEGPENDAVIDILNEKKPDVLFVCLGSPAQEIWINNNRSRLPDTKVFLALGGSLDGYSGTNKRAPKFFIDHNLEWFYRLIKQPSRIGRMMKLPKFYFGTWLYKIRNKK